MADALTREQQNLRVTQDDVAEARRRVRALLRRLDDLQRIATSGRPMHAAERSEFDLIGGLLSDMAKAAAGNRSAV